MTMNRSIFPPLDFDSSAAGNRPSDFATEETLGQRAQAYEANRRMYFQQQDWRLASYALDLLLEETAGKFRDDGVTPEWIHSARPTEWLESLIAANLIDRDSVEKKYGSLEIAICDWLLHDLGENEGVTADFLKNYFIDRIKEDEDPSYAPAQRQRDMKKIPSIVRDFKLLTNGKNGAVPFNIYLDNLSQSGYAFLVKLGDRLDNLATFIGLKRPCWHEMSHNSTADRAHAMKYFARITRYNQHTYENFALDDLCGKASNKHPLLSQAYLGMDCVMGFLFRINAAYVSYHPFNPKNAPHENKRVVLDKLVLDVSKYWQGASRTSAGLHHGANPMEMLLGRVKQEVISENIPGLAFKLQLEPHDRHLNRKPPQLFGDVVDFLHKRPGAPAPH